MNRLWHFLSDLIKMTYSEKSTFNPLHTSLEYKQKSYGELQSWNVLRTWRASTSPPRRAPAGFCGSRRSCRPGNATAHFPVNSYFSHPQRWDSLIKRLTLAACKKNTWSQRHCGIGRLKAEVPNETRNRCTFPPRARSIHSDRFHDLSNVLDFTFLDF